MVDGKFLFLTSLREIMNLIEPILRDFQQIRKQFICSWGNETLSFVTR